ncbi:recombinase family protein [Streptomyces halobius]|uniref:Uncharacterized protein n=1 Tax=Streptomyces halobius TaxID=2879846 RepID=A0ABY4M0U6_9ACTN|nr:hypothetical protein [Streptomyces halobius]UQA90763.1 hypothetical protein K9S39_01660 [Streptomyces halobius]
MQIEPARLLQEPTDPDRPVLAEMVADLEPGDEVTVFNREVVGDDAAAAIEEKGATLHSVTEPHQPTRTFGYVRTANGSADLTVCRHHGGSRHDPDLLGRGRLRNHRRH